jgi:hypothetical protein
MERMGSHRCLILVKVWFFALLLGGWPAFGSAAAPVIEVRPADGVAGIQAALKSLREMRARASVPFDQPARIVLLPGEYVLSEPLKISAQDSGTVVSPTVIESKVRGGAVLVGAPAITATPSHKGLTWLFVPPSRTSRSDERSGGQLFVNGQRAVLAQHPNRGQFFFIDSPLPAENGTDTSKAAFVATAKDLAEISRLTEGDRDRAILSLMQSWTSSEHRLSRVHESGVVNVAPAAKWPFLSFGHSQRYVIKNLPRALDAPGEWVLEDGSIKFWPLSGEKPAQSDARWPRFSTLVKVQGDARSGRWVQHVELKGVGLAYTGVTTPMAGWLDVQAAVDVGAAIEVDDAKHFVLADCRIQHTGGYGVWFRRSVQGSVVRNCELDDLGAGGIKVGETSPDRTVFATSGNTIEANKISNTGLDFPGAVAVWVGHSSNNNISKNIIHRTSYSGISIGWQWGYAAPTATHNVITQNILYDIGMAQMSDMGAIYTLGRSPGTEISGNFIRRVQAYPGYGPGAWGIYNDEGSSDIKVFGNVVLETDSGGYHLHYGRDLSITGNLFAHSRGPEVRWTSTEKSGAWQLSGNGIAAPSAKWLEVRGNAQSLSLDRNVMGVNAQGPLRVSSSQQVADVQVKGAPANEAKTWLSVIEQTRQSIGNAHVSNNILPPSVRPAADRWAVNLSIIPIGGRPVDVRTFPKLPADAISVAMSAEGEKVLVMVDGTPGMARYDPHYFFPVEVEQGPMVSRFSVMLDAQSELVHEWRDASASYNTGPKMVLNAGTLIVAGKAVAKLPLNQWLDFELEQNLADSDGRWSFRWRSADAGSAWSQFGPYSAAGPAVPKRWRWVGWYANGTTHSRIRMKGMEFTRPLR